MASAEQVMIGIENQLKDLNIYVSETENTVHTLNEDCKQYNVYINQHKEDNVQLMQQLSAEKVVIAGLKFELDEKSNITNDEAKIFEETNKKLEGNLDNLQVEYDKKEARVLQ